MRARSSRSRNWVSLIVPAARRISSSSSATLLGSGISSAETAAANPTRIAQSIVRTVFWMAE